jgi:hypothetical protein
LGLTGGIDTGGPLLLGTWTNSARQTPNPDVGPDPLPQSTLVHLPPLSTCVLDAQDKQPELPPDEHDAQEESQLMHVEEEVSKYCVLAHVGTQRLSLVRTGLFEGHERHWLKEGPEQVAQSGWQRVHALGEEDENMFVGQDETQVP